VHDAFPILKIAARTAWRDFMNRERLHIGHRLARREEDQKPSSKLQER
jgi:hypothetical protein